MKKHKPTGPGQVYKENNQTRPYQPYFRIPITPNNIIPTKTIENFKNNNNKLFRNIVPKNFNKIRIPDPYEAWRSYFDSGF